MEGLPTIVYEGSIAFRRPAMVLIHYYSPSEEYYCSNDSLHLFYSVTPKAGIRFKKANLAQVEQQILQLLGKIEMNTLATMRDGYEFSFVGSVGDSDVVVSAVPKSGWKELSKIWLKISRKRHYLVGSELYDKHGALVSQSVYFDPQRVQTMDCWYPSKTLIKTIDKNKLRVEKIEYSRIRFNGSIGAEEFHVPIAPDAEIVEPQPEKK